MLKGISPILSPELLAAEFYIRFIDITRDKLGLDGTVNGVEPLHLFNYGTFLFIHGLYLLVF